MERREWRGLAIGSILVLCLVLLSCIPLRGTVSSRTMESVMQAEVPEATEEPVETEEPLEEEDEETVLSFSEKEVKTAKETVWKTIEQEEKKYIKLPKLADGVKVYLQEDYMSSKVVLNLSGNLKKTYGLSSVTRSFDDHVYTGKLKDGELLEKIVFKQTKEKKKTTVKVILTLKKILEPALYETEDAYYITLTEPKKVYDHILVLDAGHGGMDEGTMSVDRKYDEKSYTLMIVQKLRKMFEGKRIKVYCTRTEDVYITKRDRVGLANKLHADLFISVHCNAAEAGERHIRGLETLYSKVPLSYGSLTSKKLAEIMLDELHQTTTIARRGTIDREGLYILRNSKVPATIVEVGYMTNMYDMDFMKSGQGKELIVKGLYQGIIKALKK